MKMKPVKPYMYLCQKLLSKCTVHHYLHFCDMNVMLTLVKIDLLTVYYIETKVAITTARIVYYRNNQDSHFESMFLLS